MRVMVWAWRRASLSPTSSTLPSLSTGIQGSSTRLNFAFKLSTSLP
jgi:hypothetical protein